MLQFLPIPRVPKYHNHRKFIVIQHSNFLIYVFRKTFVTNPYKINVDAIQKRP